MTAPSVEQTPNGRGSTIAPSWVLQPDGVFDPSGEVVKGLDVVVSDGLIESVVERGAALPANARVVRVPGSTLLPGLIDSHVHLTFSSDAHIVRNVTQDSMQAQLARAAGNAQRALSNGVTTVMDCGGMTDVVVPLRDAIAAGTMVGPRMLVAGSPITTTAGHCHWLGGVADTLDEMIRVARQQVAQGVDVVKLMLTGGNLTPGSNPSRLQYSPQALEALVLECQRLGKPLIVHAHSSEAVSHCARLGVRIVAHATCVDANGDISMPDALISDLRTGGCFVDPTIMVGLSASASADPAAAERRQRQRAEMLPLFRRMHEGGVPLLAGTDSGVTGVAHGTSPSAVVALCRELGLAPGQAVLAATSVPARALGLDGRVGEIKAGAVADLLLVDGDISEEIEAVLRPAAVWKAGSQVVNRGALEHAAG